MLSIYFKDDSAKRGVFKEFPIVAPTIVVRHAPFSRRGRPGSWGGRSSSRDLYVSDTQLRCIGLGAYGELRACAGYADSSSPYGAAGTTYRLLIRQ